MKHKIDWKQWHKIEMNGYVNGKIKYTINSFYNRNFAIPINKEYIGETWLIFNKVCFKLNSVSEAFKVADLIENTGKPPKNLKALFPQVWASWYKVFSPMFYGKKVYDLGDIGIKVNFPIQITNQKYPD